MTRLRTDSSLTEDRITIDGEPASETARKRAVLLVDRVRAAARERVHVRLDSTNDFPTASGLASSASGFAALALAAVRLFGLDWNSDRVSNIARQSSASAARSVFGGSSSLQRAAPRARCWPRVRSRRSGICLWSFWWR